MHVHKPEITVTGEDELWFVRVDGIIRWSGKDLFEAMRLATKYGFHERR